MCQALKEIMEEDFKKVESEAEKRGEKNGEKRGEKKLCDLITKLIAANRNDDIAKATSNISFRKKLYKEFQISWHHSQISSGLNACQPFFLSGADYNKLRNSFSLCLT